MTGEPRIFCADWGTGLQPVRPLDEGRTWTLHKSHGPRVLTDKNCKQVGCVGSLFLTRGHDTTALHARPNTLKATKLLVRDLRAYPLPQLPKDVDPAAQAVYTLLPLLAEQGLGLVLLDMSRHIRGRWPNSPTTPEGKAT